MEEKNPFEGIKTYDRYGRLWGLTAAIVLLHFVVMLPVVLVEKHTGLRFSSLESMIPVFLAIGAVSALVMSGMGVSWRSALADWRRNLGGDALKALKYFGGYALVALCIAGVLFSVWWFLGDSGMEKLLQPVTERASSEGAALQAAASVSYLRLSLSVLSACVLAPVAEELFFRRIFYTTVRLRNGFWFSAFWSGLFFAVCHGAAAPILLPVGIYFCWVYERERRLPVNILLHSLVNVTMLFNRMLA
ncbi:MAG: hypothetical protein A2X31_12445 [Elusimicrobia bacterium GWB2_63_22]|nr:MAG: hypothetical protein A2X31_12445 [Elusimicrobia bacterium GWB2_63_22]